VTQRQRIAAGIERDLKQPRNGMEAARLTGTIAEKNAIQYKEL
jgi:hypothetical protein